ncbi:hypothetical protein Rumeso_03953 [Rubellimicrobium mesophilum DSM 19309]|uniref:Uncharacterized protein n=1 Tax=Rubellimicrobium mesophilum DSM 19309 TaxID=442562 RepID=A0A017HL23_9RHOB|nr:hypothetical protein Rumeso_03953 [Rubellimicrobium mesophilum DSM 19309]
MTHLSHRLDAARREFALLQGVAGTMFVIDDPATIPGREQPAAARRH